MVISYKKLWKLLIDRDMKKKELQKEADVSQYVMLRLSRNESVNSDALVRICRTLKCSFDDIMEINEE